MKTRPVLIIFTCVLLAGCTIPCDIYLRNLTNETVKLRAALLNRWQFNQLPNKASFYALPEKSKDMIGKWKNEVLVTWVDSTHFYIELPPNTAIDLSDISNGLTLGTKSLGISLVALQQNKTDTISTGDYIFLANKFKQEKKLFSKPVYWYDLL